MLNAVRKTAFAAYLRGIDPLPVKRGKLTIARLLTRTFGRAVYQIDGVNLELDPTSNLDRSILSSAGHDTVVLQLMRERLASGGVFIDVGANLGYFSLLAARMPGVQVFAFEPSRRELQRLYRNVHLNRVPGYLTVLPYGLSDEEGPVSLHIASDANPGLNSVIDLGDHMRYVKTEQCWFVRFDSILPPSICRQVRLCKIDVEGFELSVLRGMDASMSMMADAAFVVEISRDFMKRIGQQPHEIYDFFSRHGFEPQYGLQDRWQYDEVFRKRDTHTQDD